MKAKTVSEAIQGIETIDSYLKASKHVPDHPLTLVKKDLIKEFEKSGVKPALKIGKRYKIMLPNGRDMEGPFENKERAKKLNDKLQEEIDTASWELEEEGIFDDDAFQPEIGIR